MKFKIGNVISKYVVKIREETMKGIQEVGIMTHNLLDRDFLKIFYDHYTSIEKNKIQIIIATDSTEDEVKYSLREGLDNAKYESQVTALEALLNAEIQPSKNKYNK